MHLSMRRLSALYKAIVVSIFVITGLLVCFISIKAIAAPVDFDIPAQPLSNSLKLVAKATGASVAFDSKVTEGITAPAIKGRMESFEAIRKLLAGTGLEASTEGTTTLIKRSFEPTKDSNALELNIPEVSIRAKRSYEIGPMPGLALTKEEIPGNVQSITAKQIKDAHSVSLADLMNSQLQSVNVNDYQGNPFQMDVTYRGFTAGPQIGTPQGLSVFLDGIRVNEPFGDVVNWDMIPLNALAGMDVFPGSNPIFGLNTLGGAIAMRTKNGFDDAGVQADVLTGAFGRKQFQLSAGGSKGDVAGFVALNLFDENGWRQDSPSKVNQIFSKLSYRNDKLSLDGSMLYASNNLVGNGLVPTEMYQQNSTSVFSSPDNTKNELMQFQIASAFQVSDTFNVTGQIYNRKSDRNAVTGDINRDFSGLATRRPTSTENPVCAYSSTNPYKITDYYLADDICGPGGACGVSTVVAGGYTSAADAITNGAINPATFNQALPPEAAALIAAATQIEANMFHGTPNDYHKISGLNSPGLGFNSDSLGLYDGNGDSAQVYDLDGGTWNHRVNDSTMYFTDAAGDRHYLIPADPLNATAATNGCGSDSINASGTARLTSGQIRALENGSEVRRNGADTTLGNGKGYVDGTPTALISTNNINQLVKGGAVQFNWNLDQHKFMVGSSIDHATNTYSNSQMLGLLDANRRAYLDPANIGAEFAAASTPILNNSFSGSSDTRSLYLSETYSPKENLHLSFAARYNYTTVMTNMRVRNNTLTVDPNEITNLYMDYLLCNGLGLDSCDQNLLNNPLLNSIVAYPDAYFGEYHKERFNYRSLNPSFGATWSPKQDLNLYANWNQGTRTPSAIELGCAFDKTPVTQFGSHVYTTPQALSLVNGSSCTLPSALSGDPYLPQVVSRTLELGARGKLNQNLSWNASVYQTNLTDDIYFVGYTANQSFFDTIGKTRRQGIEMGISGKYDKFDFKVNYALTDATFQTTTQIANADNSSVNHSTLSANRDLETISPGNRMPGIPLNNINTSFGYQISDQWRVNLNMVAHGGSYARGNENNQHQAGTYSYLDTNNASQIITVNKNYISNGKTAGFAVLNFNTSYDFGRGWSGTLLINNILDKEYYSASRLGINPFSPSINGAIGASGFNYNSNDWNSTTFVAPGAPRAAWISVRYEFDADKK